MDGTIIGQGRFVSAGAATTVQIPSNADWMKVLNYTKFGTAGDGNVKAVESLWQRGMAAGTGIIKYYDNGGQVLTGDTYLTGGFTLYDPASTPEVGTAIATTASTNATRPVVSTGTTPSVGQVVRLSNTAQTDVNGVDMVVGAVNAGVSFTLLFAGNALATAPGAIGGAGFYRVVNTDPLYYPRRRYVSNITRALNAQVSTTVAHGLTVGQEVRFNIPPQSGMVQLNQNIIAASIVSVVDDYNFTINVDTSAYTAFTWPTIAQMPSSFPTVTPVGEDTALSLSSPVAQTPVVGGVQIYNTNSGILADSTVNTGFLGMTLGFGGTATIAGVVTNGPAGAANDVIYWVAGKSMYGGL